jgi:hypothetical protein
LIEQHTRFTSWKIKNASFNLPTLDILNQNYPRIMNQLKSCFHCNIENETNEHFWICPETISQLRPVFIKHEKILITLLQQHSDNYNSLIENTIKITRIFSWSRNNHFLHGFIPNDLIHPFTFHIKGHKKIKSLFLSFINNLSFDIRSSVWKNRNSKFKEWKKHNHITQNSFKNYKHHKKQLKYF